MEVKIKVRNLKVGYGEKIALKSINLDIYRREILSIIGPANSGKTSFLQALNRLNEININCQTEGEILLDGEDIKKIDVNKLRRRIGMVFALPIPFPATIYENVIYGLKNHKKRLSKEKVSNIVEKSLKAAFLWEEVKDRLFESALKLSGGQQQRLCIARSLAISPEVILFDEPCSGLDPISTAKVEEALLKLKEEYTIVLVTNNTKQAARVSDRTAFFLMGELVEINNTAKIFTIPKDKRTDDYISGVFG